MKGFHFGGGIFFADVDRLRWVVSGQIDQKLRTKWDGKKKNWISGWETSCDDKPNAQVWVWRDSEKVRPRSLYRYNLPEGASSLQCWLIFNAETAAHFHSYARSSVGYCHHKDNHLLCQVRVAGQMAQRSVFETCSTTQLQFGFLFFKHAKQLRAYSRSITGPDFETPCWHHMGTESCQISPTPTNYELNQGWKMGMEKGKAIAPLSFNWGQML